METPINKKKNQKKILRGLQIINKDLGFGIQLIGNYILGKPGGSGKSISETLPESKNVVIINGGLTTGVDEVSLIEFFAGFGFTGIERIIMVPGKQYCFVSFSSPAEAFRAVEVLSGIKSLPGSTCPLYLGCIDTVPTIENTVKYEVPPGLNIIENFISIEEEELLCNLIKWENSPSHIEEGSILKHRQVRHFGYEFKYGSNSVDKSSLLEQKIPKELFNICQRIVDKKLMSEFPDQLTVNRYLPGQGIPSHVDTHRSFTDEILSLSVKGGTSMDFNCKNFDGQNCGEKNIGGIEQGSLGNRHYSVYLPARSLCVMSGPSRYAWMHGICPRKTDVVPDINMNKQLTLKPRKERISFTFRKVRQGECQCQYRTMCDSQLFGKENSCDKIHHGKTPSELEKEHVLRVYEEIADHFSYTRHKPWPKILEFVQSLPKATFMLDVGCGNGKYLGHNTNIYQLGCDTSAKLLEVCNKKEFEVVLSNCLLLPYRTGTFDAVICIAVIHHLASKDRRKRAVTEIIRVMAAGGRALIYVWAMEQNKGKKSTYLKQKRSNRSKKHVNLTQDSNVTLTETLNEHTILEENGVPSVNMDAELAYRTAGINEDNNKDTVDDTLFVHENRTEFLQQDLFVPWKIKPEKYQSKVVSDCEDVYTNALPQTLRGPKEKVPVFHRYYHVFKEWELESLLKSFDSINIINSYYDEGNWCVLFEKIDGS